MQIGIGAVRGIAACLLAGGFFAFPQTVPIGQNRIKDLNRQIGLEHDAAVMHGLLAERSRLLAGLMQQNPRAAVESALSSDLRRDLANRIPDAESLLEEKGEWTGPLVTSVADDFAHTRSWVSRTIRVQGHAIDLFWDSPPAVSCSPSATVRGIRLGDRIAAVSGEATADATSPCSTTGDQKTVVLLLSYPSTPLTPGYTQSYVHDLFFGSAPSVSDYWREASYGSTSASGDVFGPFTLDADYTCGQTDTILQAAIQAADATVDFTAYQRIFLILPVTVGQYCGWDGLAQLGCSTQQSPSKGAFSATVSWLQALSMGPNIYGALGGMLSTAIHEGGHNFGLRHASSIDYDTLAAGPPGVDGIHSEYGDPFSFMGYDPGHFAAPHKNLLGWLTEGTGWLQVQSAGTWTLAPLSEASGAPHALRVQRGSAGTQWLWIEYRQPIGSCEPTVLDNGGPRDFDGALIHFEDSSEPTWTGYTELLDLQPVRLPNDFNSSLLKPGSVWSDPYSNLTITAGAATPTGMTMTVSYDGGCATLSSQAKSVGPSGDSGQISVSAGGGCSWTAVASAEWISFTGAASGIGNGTVGYTVAANTSTTARTGIISISHQTFTVTQAPFVQAGSVSATPASGSGAGQTFRFVFSDPISWSNLSSGEILINGSQVSSGACYIHWDAAGNTLALRSDADDAWIGPIPVGGSGSLANTQCVVPAGNAAVKGTGASATLSLTINFTNRFADSTKNVYMEAQSAATAVGWQQTGTWTVDFAFVPVSVSPKGGRGETQRFTFKMDGIYDGDLINLNFTTSTALGTLQFFDNSCAISLSNAATPDVFLYDDLYTGGGSNSTLGTGSDIENSQCILNAAASSAVLSGSTLTLLLEITFKSAFFGRKDIYLFGPGTGYPTGASNAPIGTFTVAAPDRPARTR